MLMEKLPKTPSYSLRKYSPLGCNKSWTNRLYLCCSCEQYVYNMDEHDVEWLQRDGSIALSEGSSSTIPTDSQCQNSRDITLDQLFLSSPRTRWDSSWLTQGLLNSCRLRSLSLPVFRPYFPVSVDSCTMHGK